MTHPDSLKCHLCTDPCLGHQVENLCCSCYFGCQSRLPVSERVAKLADHPTRFNNTNPNRKATLMTDRNRANLSAADALKYAATLLRSRADWIIAEIGGAMCEDEMHETPLDALDDLVDQIGALALAFGDPRRYSDGRLVKTRATIENHFATEHLWHPTPGVEKPCSWSGALMHDPGTPDRGLFTVNTNPTDQTIHVCVVRTDLLT